MVVVMVVVIAVVVVIETAEKIYKNNVNKVCIKENL